MIMKLRKRLNNKFYYVIPALLISFSVFSQDGDNLVDNGSFEKANGKKIRRIGEIQQASGWNSTTGNRADLFSVDANSPEVQTPDNVYGSEEPKDGSNYAGIIAYSYREKENRTYLTTELNTPLKKGMRYKVQFYASLAELSKYSTNKLGAHFSRRDPSTTQRVPGLSLETHVEHPKGEAFDALYGWDLVCGEYVADGKEKFLTIGNFTNENDLTIDRVRKPRNVRGTQIIAAYYYIDDVSVRLLGPDEKCNCNYPDEAVSESSTMYQRAPVISQHMTPAQILEEHNIYYQSGRYDIRSQGERTIDKIIELLEANPSLNIQIIGHADGFETSNAGMQDISFKRANYIESILLEEGISRSRIDVKDDKDRTPSQYISTEDDDSLRSAKNRRVSFKTF